jgi:hypothetical protein
MRRKPGRRKLSPNDARIAENDKWRSFFLIGYGADGGGISRAAHDNRGTSARSGAASGKKHRKSKR